MKIAKWMLSGTFLLPCAALAASMTQLESVTDYTVRADATYVEDNFVRVRVDEQTGIRGAGQIPLVYSTSLHTLEVLEAYTTTKDGKKIEVTPDKIMEQQLPQSSGAPMFSDHKVKMVIFPQVEVGSVITLRYRRTQNKPDFPGLFSIWESPPRSVDLQNASVTLTAPEDLELHIDTREAAGGPVESPAPGQRRWAWKFADAKAAIGEPRQVSARDLAPYVMVSTYSSYEQLAEAHAQRAKPMEQPSAEVRKLAEEITKGIKDKRAQAAALYQWVGLNVRYVAIFLELGGYVPHTAEEIRAARYGDCKDHATLLKALLSAKGIRSSVALVQATDGFLVPETVMHTAFNHMITYLPDFDLFVDSTPGILPFGVLAPSEGGKRALVVDLGKGKPGFLTLPLPKPQSDWVVNRSELTVAEDGTVTGALNGESAGIYQGGDRQMMHAIPKDQLPRLAERMLGGAGTQTIAVGDPLDFSKPFSYGSTVKLPTYLKIPGPGAISLPAGLSRMNGTMAQFVAFAALQKREVPFGCPTPGRRTEVVKLKIPANLKITALPKDVKVANKFGSYESSHAHEGDTLTTTRTLTLEYPGPVCTVEDYADLKTMSTQIAQDLRSPITYE